MAKKPDTKSYTIGRAEPVVKAYQERLKILKKAQEYSAQDEIPKAVQHYSQYLNILAQYFDVPESSLSPLHFNRENDLAEMLLISHVYWDLAKAYDRSPTLTLESIRCLKQFVAFTHGFKFQYANSQMVKKFIRQRLAHNPKAFKEAYDKIRVEAKGCYIATHCYGENHIITNSLRQYRDHKLSQSFMGRVFIQLYYFISPSLVRLANRHPNSRVRIDAIFKQCIQHFIKLNGIIVPNDSKKSNSH